MLGKRDTDEVTFDEAAAAAATFAAKPFNGDGIVPADSASDDATKAVIADIINCLGAATDASGKPGVNQAKVDQFFAEAAAYSDWWKKAESDVTVLPLGVEHRSRRRRGQSREGQGGRLFCARSARRV